MPLTSPNHSPRSRLGLALALILALVPSATQAAQPDDWAPNLTTTATWHNNAANSGHADDELGAFALQADLLSGKTYPFGRDDALRFTGHLGAEWWPRFKGLTQGAGGARAEWRHAFGTGQLAPTLSLEGAADAIAAKETGRRGVATGVTLVARKRLDPRTRFTLSHEVSRLAARYGLFDRTAHETTLALDRDFGDASRLSFSVHHRDGDFVTYATVPRPDLAALAPHSLDLDTFGRPMRAYRIDARTWTSRIAYTRALHEQAALVVAGEWRSTRRAALSVTNLLLSIAIVHQY